MGKNTQKVGRVLIRMKINILQEKVIQYFKNELRTFDKNKVDTAESALSFVGTWGENLGFESLKLNCLNSSNKLNYLILLLKDLYTALKFSEIEYSNNFNSNEKNNLILSTASENDIDTNGHYTDRYLKINSRNYQKFIFILIYAGSSFPKKLDENIILLKKKKNFTRGILKLLKSIKKCLLKKFSIKYFFHFFSDHSNFANELCETIVKKIDFKNINSILIPFEGIPYQQKFIEKIKKINKNISITGYDHSAPHAMPLNLYHRGGSPDFLIVNGSSQIDHLNNFLNWPKDKLIEMPSLRYEQNSNENFNNIVFLPWKIFDTKKILKDVEKFIQNVPDKSLNPLTVKTHPVCVNFKTQEKIKNDLNFIFRKNLIKFSQDFKAEPISIFIGSTTGVIVALEKGLKILHICFDPIFESYSEYLWPNLNVKKITENTFIYTLKKKGTFIKFGEGKKTFENYYKNFG